MISSGSLFKFEAKKLEAMPPPPQLKPHLRLRRRWRRSLRRRRPADLGQGKPARMHILLVHWFANRTRTRTAIRSSVMPGIARQCQPCFQYLQKHCRPSFTILYSLFTTLLTILCSLVFVLFQIVIFVYTMCILFTMVCSSSIIFVLLFIIIVFCFSILCIVLYYHDCSLCSIHCFLLFILIYCLFPSSCSLRSFYRADIVCIASNIVYNVGLGRFSDVGAITENT
jgi:hypothetical protein